MNGTLNIMKEYNKDKLNRVKRGAKRAVYDKATVHQILDAGFIAHVGYQYEGYSIAIPMAYGKKGDHIYLHGSTANRMLLAILANKKVAMTVMHLDGLVLARSGFHHSVNYRSVTLFGSVTSIDDDQKKIEILEIVTNNMVPNRWETLREINQKELDRTLVLEFTIETASAKVRAEGVNDEPDDYQENVWAGVIPIKQIAEKPIPDQGYPETIELPDHIKEYYKNHKFAVQG